MWIRLFDIDGNMRVINMSQIAEVESWTSNGKDGTVVFHPAHPVLCKDPNESYAENTRFVEVADFQTAERIVEALADTIGAKNIHQREMPFGVHKN